MSKKIQLLTIESALNTALFAERYFLDKYGIW